MTDPDGYPIITNTHPATHSAWSTKHYRYRGDDSGGTHRVYANVPNSLLATDPFPTSINPGYDIKVNIATNVWSDLGTDWPGTVTDGTNVSLHEGSMFLFYFPKPASTDYPSSSTPPSPYVTWFFPNHVCGQNTYVGVTHVNAQSNSTTYYVHELGVGQIGTITVGTGAYPSTSGSGNFLFTISARTLQVINPGGAVIGTKVFSCASSSGKKVHTNFW